MRRSRIHAALLGTLVLGPFAAAGCRAATYSASHAVAPVLVGPVACIGCEPTPPPRAASGDFADHALVEDWGGGGGGSSSSGHRTDFPLLVLKAGALVRDACLGQIQVSRTHVVSYGSDMVGGIAE